uniref:Putative polyprotein n=1 Tax=Albugo laibachii Nc14 TaxID=890382 RepID=F0WQE3_9STRA|nr:putative polyprotein [Albugo laibachii Nc14]|eukprot:CCA23551.1 putative polyprotein [Albugo laibachii Nc14]
MQKVWHKQADSWKSNKAESEETYAFTTFQESRGNWILDSGASSHMCPNKSEFTDLQALKKKIPISIANGSKVDAVGVGNIFARLKNNKNIKIDDVLYVFGLNQKLLSVSALAEIGLQIVFRNLTCEIKSDDRSIVEIQRIGKLFVLECKTLEVAPFGGEAGYHGDVLVDESIWHARFGYISTKRMRNMKNYVVGLDMTTKLAMDCEESEMCERCINGKSSVQSFGSSAYGKVKRKALLEVVHSNVTGPMRVKSQGGARYMVTFIDDFSRLIHAYFIQSKGKVFNKFTEFKSLFGNQFGKRIKCMRSDNGGEYINDKFANLCKNSGIIHQTMVPYLTQHKGVAG